MRVVSNEVTGTLGAAGDPAGRTNEHAIDWMDMQIGSTTRRTEPGR